MKLNLKVEKMFKDVETKALRQVGQEFSLNEESVERINDLLKRGLCSVKSVEVSAPEINEAKAPDNDSKSKGEAPKLVMFREKEYPLAAVRVALESIGAPIASNGGVPSATKKIESLTDEQADALAAALSNVE